MVREVYSEALYEKGKEPWTKLIREFPKNLACKEVFKNIASKLEFVTKPSFTCNF
jgi:hypothetical protein